MRVELDEKASKAGRDGRVVIGHVIRASVGRQPLEVDAAGRVTVRGAVRIDDAALLGAILRACWSKSGLSLTEWAERHGIRRGQASRRVNAKGFVPGAELLEILRRDGVVENNSDCSLVTHTRARYSNAKLLERSR